ncbi:nuclear transport factor 2 family protein [Rhizorhabdus histidinilytica]
MDEQSLIAAEHRRRRLSVEGDAAGLEAMMADGFYYAHLNGLTDDRESYLARIRAGEVHYTTMTAHDLDAHLIGSAGWIRVSPASAIAGRTLARKAWPRHCSSRSGRTRTEGGGSPPMPRRSFRRRAGPSAASLGEGDVSWGMGKWWSRGGSNP